MFLTTYYNFFLFHFLIFLLLTIILLILLHFQFPLLNNLFILILVSPSA